MEMSFLRQNTLRIRYHQKDTVKDAEEECHHLDKISILMSIQIKQQES